MGHTYHSLFMVLVISLSIFAFAHSTMGFNSNNDIEFSGLRTVDNDNSFETATTMVKNSVYSNSLDTEDDEIDFYKINLKANATTGDLLFINLSLASSFDAVFITVYNPEKYLIMDELVWPLFSDEFNRSICASTSGYYYVAVIAYLDDTSYSLTAYCNSVNRITDCDNCNSEATTAVDGGNYKGLLNATFDYIDIYEVNINSGTTKTQALTAELSFYDGKYLAIYNPDGTIRDISDTIMGSVDSMEVVSFAADQTGKYRVVVGVSGDPLFNTTYSLNITITPNVPADNDYDEEHALLVFNGTIVNSSFDSDFDEFDYYMIDLDQDEYLTVSLIYLDGSGTTDIDIYDEDGYWVNEEDDFDSDLGCWASGPADHAGRYYIEVENWWFYRGNYTILFSTYGKNLWYIDEPIAMNITNLDFSMKEDSVDMSHVNLYDIFYDPDTPITFSSPTHPNGKGENMDIEIFKNGTVKFMPHQDFDGEELVTFYATDSKSINLDWSVTVTVLPVNDPPKIVSIGGVNIFEKNVTLKAKQGQRSEFEIEIVDPDNSEYLDYLTDPQHEAPADLDFTWTPKDVDGFVVLEKANSSTISFTPENSHVGIFKLNFTVHDTQWYKPQEYTQPKKIKLSNYTVTISFEVANVNDPPEFISIANQLAVPNGKMYVYAYEDKWNNYTVKVVDIDHNVGENDELRYYSNVTSSIFSIDKYMGNISFRPSQKHVGNFHTRLRVEDGKGGEAEQNVTFMVLNTNDIPSKPKINVDKLIYLTARLSADDVFDEDGDKITYHWDFGDGSPEGVGQHINHTYAKKGNYTVKLTARDVNGGTSNTSYVISVEEPPVQETKGGSGSGKGSFFSDNLMFIILIIIVIIIIMIIGLVMFFKNKKSAQLMQYSGYTQTQTMYQAEPRQIEQQQQQQYQQQQQLATVQNQYAQTYSPTQSYEQTPVRTTTPIQQSQTYGYYPEQQVQAEQYAQEQQVIPQEQPQQPREGMTIEQKLELLEQRLLRGEISQEVYLNLKTKYESEQLPYTTTTASTPTDIVPTPEIYDEVTTSSTEPIQEPETETSIEYEQTVMEPTYANCPVCGMQIKIGVAICNGCNTPLNWEG